MTTYIFLFSLSDVVCFGVGAGANVLTELAVSSFVGVVCFFISSPVDC